MFSIVIPAFNQHEMTADCLKAIIEKTSGYELILVDNGSDPSLRPMVNGVYVVNRVRNEKNLGFPVAVNQGIQAAQGDVIILLNNDCIVSKGWTFWLQKHLENFSIVGPVTNYAAGMQRVTIPVYHDREDLAREAEKWTKDHAGESQEVAWVIGFCMVFKRSLYDELGPFDESLWPCSGEEIDFCHRAREAGHRIGIARDVYVHHHGTVTFKEMEKSGTLIYKETCNRNNDHLEDKWGKDWFIQTVSAQGAPGSTIGTGLRLNLGCGYSPQEGFINIDNRQEVKPDLVCDVLEGLPYEDNTVDEIMADDFLEHIPIGKTIQVVTEIWRVLKPGGLFKSSTPDAENGQGAFQDPHHVSFWVENSWLYFSDPGARMLYGTKANFHIDSIKRVQKDKNVFHLLVIAKAIK